LEKLGQGERMEPVGVVAPLEGIAATSVVVEPRAPGHEDRVALVVQIELTLEPVAPPVELVQLVEHPELLLFRKLLSLDRPPVADEVPVEVGARDLFENPPRESRLAALPRAGDDDHLALEILEDDRFDRPRPHAKNSR
jgi:hypothetical protein